MERAGRKTIRMPHYDYSQNGIYFCTLCVHHLHRHKNIFAQVLNGQTILTRYGRIVQQCWEDIPNHRANVLLDEFQLMPNHVHFIIWLEGDETEENFKNRFGPQKSGSLGLVVGAFKSAAKREIQRMRQQVTDVWQPRFYDRVVRSERELFNIRAYIQNNPANWEEDRCHPAHPQFELAWQGHNPSPDFS